MAENWQNYFIRGTREMRAGILSERRSSCGFPALEEDQPKRSPNLNRHARIKACVVSNSPRVGSSRKHARRKLRKPRMLVAKSASLTWTSFLMSGSKCSGFGLIAGATKLMPAIPELPYFKFTL